VAGIADEHVIIDPGIGFGKTREENLEIVRRLPELGSLGYPVLIGPSRKSFIGKTLDLPANERLEGTAAAVTLSIAGGADIVRVHDVKPMVRVARMADAITRGASPHARGA
jgi:dihydropteroate synthase